MRKRDNNTWHCSFVMLSPCLKLHLLIALSPTYIPLTCFQSRLQLFVCGKELVIFENFCISHSFPPNLQSIVIPKNLCMSSITTNILLYHVIYLNRVYMVNMDRIAYPVWNDLNPFSAELPKPASSLFWNILITKRQTIPTSSETARYELIHLNMHCLPQSLSCYWRWKS